MIRAVRIPTHDTCPHALEFDYRELRGRIHRRYKWQEKEVQRLTKDIRSDNCYASGIRGLIV